MVAFRWFGWIRFSALLLYFSGGYFGPAWADSATLFCCGFGHVCCTGCGFLPRLLDLRCVGVVCVVCFAISGCCVVVSWLVAFGVYFGD